MGRLHRSFLLLRKRPATRRLKTTIQGIDPDSDLGNAWDNIEVMGAGRGLGKVMGKRTPAAECGLNTQALRHKRRVDKRRLLDLSRAANAIKQIGELPAAGESVHCIMGGDFHGFDLVPAIHIAGNGRQIHELYLTTLGFNQANADRLCAMMDDNHAVPDGVHIVCSDYFKGADRNVYLYTKREIEKRGGQVTSARNHTKIILAKAVPRYNTRQAAYYVVESSANLRSCNNIEQFCLSNDRELYEFHKKWISQLFK